MMRVSGVLRSPIRLLGRQNQKDVTFWCCDVQEKFKPRIGNWDRVVHVAKMFAQAAPLVNGGDGGNFIVTEQYPKALGRTDDDVKAVLPAGHMYADKVKFAMTVDPIMKHLKQRMDGQAQHHAVIFGIEAHVCIMQTAFELQQMNVQVHVAADGVSSQRSEDRERAIGMMERAGCNITTSESILLQLMGEASGDQFKAISKILRQEWPPLDTTRR